MARGYLILDTDKFPVFVARCTGKLPDTAVDSGESGVKSSILQVVQNRGSM